MRRCYRQLPRSAELCAAISSPKSQPHLHSSYLTSHNAILASFHIPYMQPYQVASLDRARTCCIQPCTTPIIFLAGFSHPLSLILWSRTLENIVPSACTCSLSPREYHTATHRPTIPPPIALPYRHPLLYRTATHRSTAPPPIARLACRLMAFLEDFATTAAEVEMDIPSVSEGSSDEIAGDMEVSGASSPTVAGAATAGRAPSVSNSFNASNVASASPVVSQLLPSPFLSASTHASGVSFLTAHTHTHTFDSHFPPPDNWMALVSGGSISTAAPALSAVLGPMSGVGTCAAGTLRPPDNETKVRGGGSAKRPRVGAVQRGNSSRPASARQSQQLVESMARKLGRTVAQWDLTMQEWG
ncbi:uncharacterized protein PHACADRAFT_23638 [Phanerochaete carnosa HHB-10118-sp]|uniref:Uncharacterized protein n=1 Tax=Phanerochaete carnosa (strain HHB-10118-sp) TaxID=650164 RepID=K5W8D2_PHACS|nr:uncharacterized protein PHACADRAFT_23638 [Phanerochaete carnosa HHB-10118-sp]EKM60213.1 hypothetical protein PHACADRAFT_23638 [Phanerochaete carnosa HHB-10118-sp]